MAERNEIIAELTRISRELEQAAEDLRRCKGIGAEQCSAKLNNLSDKYQGIKQKLYQVY
jgi:predicted nuclease with TOPRIM domain